MTRIVHPSSIRKVCITAFLLTITLILQPLYLNAEGLTLDKALQIAFKNSPSIQEAGFNLDRSENLLKAQEARLKSQFNLTIQPFRYSNQQLFNELTSSFNTLENTKSEAQLSITQPIKWTDGTLSIVERFSWQEGSSSFTGSVKESNFSNSLFLTFNQPLFTYNRTKLETQELKWSLENTQLMYTIQMLNIENQVTQQFLNLYYSKRRVEIAQQELKNNTESYDIIKSKVDAGIAAQVELYQADLTRLNSQAALENQQNSYENALDNFRILLGLPFEESMEIVADIRKSIKTVDLVRALEHGLEHRLELRQRDINIQTAMNDLITTNAMNEFKGSVDLTFGLTGTDPALKHILQQPNNDKVIGLSFNIPVFDWGEKKHRMAASRAMLENRKLDKREQERQIQLEIRETYRNLQNQETQIEIAEKNVVNAQLTYDINLEQYKLGALTSMDMQLYQNQLSNEMLNEVQALITYRVGLLELKIRTLWDFEKNRSVLDQIKTGDDQ